MGIGPQELNTRGGDPSGMRPRCGSFWELVFRDLCCCGPFCLVNRVDPVPLRNILQGTGRRYIPANQCFDFLAYFGGWGGITEGSGRISRKYVGNG